MWAGLRGFQDSCIISVGTDGGCPNKTATRLPLGGARPAGHCPGVGLLETGLKVLKLFELFEKYQDLLAKDKRALTSLVPTGHVSAPDVKAEYLCVSRRRVEVQAQLAQLTSRQRDLHPPAPICAHMCRPTCQEIFRRW